MQYDFSRIDDIDSFVSIPEGRYLCRVAEVREGVSRDGSPRWSLRLEVTSGDYAGRTAGWDSLTWSERGIRRVKHVLEALGLDVTGQVELLPADLLAREVIATFQSEEREDAFTGRRVLRLRVPYAGYSPSAGGAAAALAGATANAGSGSTVHVAGGSTVHSAGGPTAEVTAASATVARRAPQSRNGAREAEARQRRRPVDDSGGEPVSSDDGPSAASAAGLDEEFED